MSTGRRATFAIGDGLVEPDLNRISTPRESIYLRKQLMEVLVYLAGLDGRVATLESLHDDLWRGKIVSSGTIYNCIADLRQAPGMAGRSSTSRPSRRPAIGSRRTTRARATSTR